MTDNNNNNQAPAKKKKHPGILKILQNAEESQEY